MSHNNKTTCFWFKKKILSVFQSEQMVFNMALGNCGNAFRPDFGPDQYSVNQLWLYDVYTAKTTVLTDPEPQISLLWLVVPWPQVWPINTHHLILSNFHSESDVQSYILFTRVAWITWVDLWLLISLDSCLCCEDVIKSKLVYTVLMRPKIRQKHVSAVTQRHVKNHLFMTQLAAGFAAKGLLNLMTSSPVATGLVH